MCNIWNSKGSEMGQIYDWRSSSLWHTPLVILKSKSDFTWAAKILWSFFKSFQKTLNMLQNFAYSLRVLVGSTTCQHTSEQSDWLLVWNDWIFLSTFLRMPQSCFLQPRFSKDEEIHCRFPSETLLCVRNKQTDSVTFTSQYYQFREHKCFWRVNNTLQNVKILYASCN